MLCPGCGGIADGGPVGTGITASVVGNVVAVEDPTTLSSAASLSAAPTSGPALDEIAQVEGIEVELVEFPDLRTTTDMDGNFSLDGAFSGAVTLRFRTADLQVDQPLDVPSGSVVVLSDIQLAPDRVTAEAGRQLAATGTAVEIDCAGGRLELEDLRGDRIDVTLLAETTFRRAGSAVTCTDIARRDPVSVEGLLDDLRGRALTALVVTIAPNSADRPPIERRVAFLGNIVAIDCRAGALSLHGERHLFRVRTTPATQIRDRRGDALECTDLALGDRITGGGLLDLRRPGFVRGQLLVRSGRLGPGAPLPIRGVVVATECDRDLLLVALGGAVVTVRIVPETTIEPPEVVCANIPVGLAAVRGNGLVSTEIPGALDARRLSFTRIQPDHRDAERP